MRACAGLLGHNISYSLSPAMHNAAFEHLGLDIRYRVFDLNHREAFRFLKAIQGFGPAWQGEPLVGMNVTIPHKQLAADSAQRRSSVVEAINACNTLLFQQDQEKGGPEGTTAILADNTDSTGFSRALGASLGFNPRGRSALILGAGGAAAAAAYALLRDGIAGVVMANRSPGRARKAIRGLRAALDDPQRARLTALPTDSLDRDDWAEALGSVDLVVNATPLGGPGREGLLALPYPQLLAGHQALYDMNYRPLTTLLMSEASKQGCSVAGGLSMLLYQGAESFRLWTGRDAPLEVMAKALEEGVKRCQ